MPGSEADAVTIDCGEKTVRVINRAIRDAAASGARAIEVLNPGRGITWPWRCRRASP